MLGRGEQLAYEPTFLEQKGVERPPEGPSAPRAGHEVRAVLKYGQPNCLVSVKGIKLFGHEHMIAGYSKEIADTIG